MTFRIANWVIGFVLSGAITIALGKSLIVEHGRKLIPALWVAGLFMGLVLGWAINAFIDYVQESATIHF
jgi:hypothetical protein